MNPDIFFNAVKSGDVQEVAQLLAQLSELAELDMRKHTDYSGKTALHIAAEHGHDSVLEILIEDNRIPLDAKDQQGLTALHLAIVNGHDKIVEQLLAKDPKLAQTGGSTKGANCMHLAAVAGHTTIVKRLISVQPSLIPSLDGCQMLALHYAVLHGHEEIVKLLLEHARVSGDNWEDQVKVLLYFAVRAGHDHIVGQFLEQNPHLLDEVDPKGKNVLHFAAENGHEQIVDRLLVAKPSLASKTDHIHRIALHGAVTRGHKTVVEKLLAHNPSSVDAVDCDGRSVLHLALCFGQTESVPCLLAHNPVGVDDKMLWCALHSGREPFDQVVKSLLAYNPKLIGSVDGSSGDTVLHRVFGFRESRGRSRYLFNEELMQAVWEMSSALEAPHKTMHSFKTRKLHSMLLFGATTSSPSTLMQWSLSLDEIVSAFHGYSKKCPQSLLDQLRECLLMSLCRDVVRVVYEYLGFGFRESKTRPNKRGRDRRRRQQKKPAKRSVDKITAEQQSEDDESDGK